MSHKKRIKIKKKNMSILLGLFLFGIIGFLLIITNRSVDIKEIKNNYSETVITTNKINLYDKKKKEIGTIEKNTVLNLAKIDINNYKDKYFQIKDSNYYILYKNIKKTNKKMNTRETNYLVFNENIKTNKKINLYLNNKKIITLKNGINIPIQYQDEKYYYISFLNNIYQVSKKEKVNIIKKDNTKEKEAKVIQVFNYQTINNTCSGYECINTNIVKEQINALKENDYYFITKEEYENYIKSYARLKEKAILLITNDENDFTKNIIEELKIPLEKMEISNEEKVKKYDIKSYTTTENILKIANQEEVIENPPVANNQGIAVLNYHFFYDASGEVCNESICLDTKKFRDHLTYLKENNYKALTMEEFKRWMYGEIELPEKSVLITIDDGAMGTGKHNGNKLIPMIEEFQLPATLFLIAGWWDISNYTSPYLTIQSHTYDMHQYGSCGRGQINCATLEEAKTDLQKSLDIIGNNDSFCFPFYYYSDTSIQAVKDLGFKLSFVGGNRKATRKSNKYLIPRYPIHSDITMEQFKSIVN